MGSGILDHDPFYRRAIIQALAKLGTPKPTPKELKQLLACVYVSGSGSESKAWLFTPFGHLEIDHVGDHFNRHLDPDADRGLPLDELEPGS